MMAWAMINTVVVLSVFAVASVIWKRLRNERDHMGRHRDYVRSQQMSIVGRPSESNWRKHKTGANYDIEGE